MEQTKGRLNSDFNRNQNPIIRQAALSYVGAANTQRNDEAIDQLTLDGEGQDKKGRKENGLVELTKRFIDLLK